MSSVIWDVGQDIQASYQHLFEVIRNSANYSKEDLLKIMEDEAKDLKDTYQNLARDHRWF